MSTLVPLLTGNERFKLNGNNSEFSVKDFWAWSTSDLLDNTTRGSVAEFLVAKALDVDFLYAKMDWEPYDLLYGETRIEVKCSSYWQSWDRGDKHPKASEIQFDISPAYAWISEEKKYSDDYKRNSDIYVFCLFGDKNKPSYDVMNLDQWRFFVIRTDELNKLGEQKSIRLNPLINLYPTECMFDGLKAAVEQNLS